MGTFEKSLVIVPVTMDVAAVSCEKSSGVNKKNKKTSKYLITYLEGLKVIKLSRYFAV
jgi:hypothetical protein